jgi:hypothetical protein
MTAKLTLFAAVALELAGALGCTPNVSTKVAPAGPSLTLEKSRADTVWIATWRFDRPVKEIRFKRPANHFRQHAFHALTAGYEIARDGDLEVIRAAGAPSSEIAVSFPEFTEFLDKEYEFFSRFSDGAVSIYTGHLAARPVYADGASCDSCFIRAITLIPPAGDEVLVGGKRSADPVTWVDQTGEGTYAYFGSTPPVATQDLISIIDPGLPKWLGVRSAEVFPRLFALYRERFGVAPSIRPTVFFSYGGSKSSGMSSGGGTLPGLIQLSVEGDGWNSESHEGLSHLFHFLAHESAHVWNGELSRYEGEVDSWMHEGSADALAERSLVALGVIDSTEFLEYQTTALNTCLQGLSHTGLRAAAKRSSQLYYSCGNIIALLSEQPVAQGKAADLFDFWRELIARARSQGGTYNADDYFAVMSERGAPTQSIAYIRMILDSGVDAASMRAALERRGAVVTEVSEPPQPFAQTLSRQAFFAFLSGDCSGRYGFRTDRSGFIVDDGTACTGLAPASVVTKIGGHDVLREGHLVWDYFHERCGASQPVVLSIAVAGKPESAVSLACPKPLPARAPYLRITSLRHVTG